MSFIWPSMLLVLVVLPLLVTLYLALLRRRRRMLAAYGAMGFGSAPTSRKRSAGLGARRHVPPALFLAGLAILVVALARPQAVVSLPRVQGTVILVFDVSGSMAADDLKPTRMEAAKVAARDFVARQPPSVLIGVVAFSDNGFSVQAPTDDSATVLVAINRLEPARGTSLGQGIAAALTTITAANAEGGLFYSDRPVEATATPTAVPAGSYAPAAIVLLSDGENNERPNPLEAAQAAAERGVRIYTVGIGSPGGATLQLEGFSVHTQLDEALLQQIAQISGGEYYQASTADDLRAVYDQLNPQLLLKAENLEVTSLFAGAGVVVFLLAGLLSLFWFGRLP
jgi:Ca-activated chloride channel family protein